jgi:uncharacterized 2Fe-2S/4Fe-4S cluster protein (DUF4445 family)
MYPLITVVSLSLDKPSPSDKRADKERLMDGLRGTGIDLPVVMELEVLRKLPGWLREHDFSVTVSLGSMGDRYKVIDIGRTAPYAVAVDIGTTNMVASLFDLTKKERVGTDEQENLQISAGPDVLSRVHLAMSGKGGSLHSLLITGINELIGKLASTHEISTDDIGAVVFSGNTIMTHFLLNLPVDAIAVENYIPVVHKPAFVSPRAIGISMHNQGIAYIFPNAGSYVGGDIISGIICSGAYKQKDPFIIVDAGTNAEIALGCDEWIMVGAGAAGPALERGIAEIGMRAVEGAICHVDISMDADAVMIETIGGGEPKGICGSGMIELISELYSSGIINQQGKFSGLSGKIRDTDGRKEFVLYESAGTTLVIRETDIENFLRSKAAMFASLYVMVKAVGLCFSDIARFYVSGALGSGIDTDKAVSIGFIPDLERSRFVALGNSSLAGAEMLLMNSSLLKDIEAVCALITYREMNTDGEFMKEFPAAMFIPHTNPEVLRC